MHEKAGEDNAALQVTGDLFKLLTNWEALNIQNRTRKDRSTVNVFTRRRFTEHTMHCCRYMASHLGSARGKQCSPFVTERLHRCVKEQAEGGVWVWEEALPFTDPQTSSHLLTNHLLHYNCCTLTHSVGAPVGQWAALRSAVSDGKLLPFSQRSANQPINIVSSPKSLITAGQKFPNCSNSCNYSP